MVCSKKQRELLHLGVTPWYPIDGFAHQPFRVRLRLGHLYAAAGAWKDTTEP